MNRMLLLIVPWCALSVPRLAHAQDASAPAPSSPPPAIHLTGPAEPANPPPPRISLDTPAVGPAQRRTYHLHEGFYLRSSVGFGSYRASFSDGNQTSRDFSQHGSSMSLDFFVGGSPSPGVAVGGGLMLEPLFSADYERNNVGLGSHSGFSTLVGPFIDGFPDATKGWHLGGLIGFAAQSFQNFTPTGSKTSSAGGVGGAAWFGYDFWVAGEWAIGPELRAMGMRTSDTKGSDDIAAWSRSFTLGISGVYN